MRLSSLKSVGTLVALTLAVTSARADDFTFSFTNTIGDASGTVTGIIYGLTNNSAGAASDVVITSFPAGLDSIYPAGPIDASAWSSQYENSFTETAGVVTAADFWAEDGVYRDGNFAQLYINGEYGYNFLNVDGDDTRFVWGNGGFDGVTFAPYTPSVTPEPSSLILLATGLAGAAGSIRRRFRK